MGLFKSLKDMKDMVHEAPDMLASANELSANAQANAAAQQAAAEQAIAAANAVPSAAAPAGGDLSPIAGVSLELYAEISKSLAEVGYDQTKAPEMAARKGVSAADWETALAGWNARITANPAVAKQFNALYTGR